MQVSSSGDLFVSIDNWYLDAHDILVAYMLENNIDKQSIIDYCQKKRYMHHGSKIEETLERVEEYLAKASEAGKLIYE